MNLKIRFLLAFMLLLALSVSAVSAQDDGDEGDDNSEAYNTTFVQQAMAGELTENELVLEDVPGFVGVIYDADEGTNYGQIDATSFANSFSYYLDSDEAGEDEEIVIDARLELPEFQVVLQLTPVDYNTVDFEATYEVVEITSAYNFTEDTEVSKLDDVYGSFENATLFLQAGDELVNKIQTGLTLFVNDPDRGVDARDTCIRGRTC